ncbi:hypothetical protein ACF3N0_00225 [Moraxella atlantae]|uniref:hypothetical protein n=1 Tax=Faucicola atlantae TaxID=34059 RepID=UPI0037525AF2
MKPMVLCVNRTALSEQNIPYYGSGLFDINLNHIISDNYHFINRKVVDSTDNPIYQNIAFHLPQILPYIAINNGEGKYLSYSRNGSETRLHGSRSIGIGGHIDLEDIDKSNSLTQLDVLDIIQTACKRELIEEAEVYQTILANQLSKIIVDTSNQVGRAHVGLFTTIVYPKANPQEELHDPQWFTLDELIDDINAYESWSRIVINRLKENV